MVSRDPVARKESGCSLSYQRRARAAYNKLSPSAKRRIAETGLGMLRGGLLSRELSNLTESTEEDSRGKVVGHMKIDPEEAVDTEELVRTGLAYQPKVGEGTPRRAVLTRLGEEVAVLGAKSTYGPSVESAAKKYSALDDVYAYLSGASYHLDYSGKGDGSWHFTAEERRKLSALKERARELRSKVAEFRDGLGSDQDRHNEGARLTRPHERGRRVTWRGRS